jgi:putative sterol carrier protein
LGGPAWRRDDALSSRPSRAWARAALEQATGTIRFDLTGGGRTARWLVAVDKGDVSVSRGGGGGECVVRVDKELFDGIASGEVNAMAALLRGAIEVAGESALLLAFQRVLPGPRRRRG